MPIPYNLNPMGRSGLPYKRRLAYLESTGTQWIDTGWCLPSDSRSFQLEMKFTPSPSQVRQWCCICGLNRSNGGGTRQYYLIALTGSSTTGITAVNGYAGSSVAFANLTEPFIVSMSYDGAEYTSVTANGNTNGFSAGLQNDQTANLYIFAPNYAPAFNAQHQNISAKLFFFRIKMDDEPIRDLIPVLDKNGAPCLFDQVTKSFFYNKGTGQFLAG